VGSPSKAINPLSWPKFIVRIEEANKKFYLRLCCGCVMKFIELAGQQGSTTSKIKLSGY